MFSYFESQGAAVNVYAAAPIQGMDPEVQDVEAVNRLVVFLAGMTEEMDSLWRAATPDDVSVVEEGPPLMTDEPLLLVATEDGIALVQIDAPRIGALSRSKDPLTAFLEIGILHAALESMCNAIAQQMTDDPLTLVVCTSDGTILGMFDADTSTGYLRDTAAFRTFLSEVKDLLASPSSVGSIDIPSDLPHRDFSPSALE